MKAITANAVSNTRRSNKYLIPALIVAAVVLIGFLAYRTQPQSETNVVLSTISQSVLEEKYGLRVNLVAVTAAGGLVDVRMKLVDAEKAKLLLSDKNNLPSLWIEDRQLSMKLSDEVISQEIDFTDDANLYLIFPNAGSGVRTGTPVTIVFGETVLEPIESK